MSLNTPENCNSDTNGLFTYPKYQCVCGNVTAVTVYSTHVKVIERIEKQEKKDNICERLFILGFFIVFATGLRGNLICVFCNKV